jgi:hypothetical protein
MKIIKELLGTIALSAIILISPAYASYENLSDTLKIIINGDTIVTTGIENLEALEDISDIDLDSIMMKVEIALANENESMDTIDNMEIIDNDNKRQIIIKNKDGKTIKEIQLDLNVDITDDDAKDIDDMDDDDFDMEFESSDEDKQIYTYFSCDMGMNNYLEGQEFPSGDMPYAVKPFGSWNFAIGTGFRTYATSWLSFDMGADLLWYNFKLEDKTVDITENHDLSIIDYSANPEYNIDENEAIRSKLTATYLDVNFMPVFHIGKETSGFNRRTFRVGLGAYAGYRIGSHSKNVWDDDGQKRKSKQSNDFYLNNFRYGAKAMIGIKEVNFFINYDINSLFEDGKGPNGTDLNAFAFGVNFTI